VKWPARSRYAWNCRPRRATTRTWRRASIDSPRFRREGSILIRRLVYVAFFLEVGLLLILLPWSGFWERNYFAASWPPLQSILTNNYVRGAVTGLGVVNLFAGFADLLLVFAARPSNVSGRPDLVEGRDQPDVTLPNGGGRT
jgi:hypothetical protein